MRARLPRRILRAALAYPTNRVMLGMIKTIIMTKKTKLAWRHFFG